jgi:3-methyl-2-oxobutanoate hydroxymethyltransferase
VLVYHDLLGLSFTPPAKFVRTYANAGDMIRQAVQAYRQDVEAGEYPSDAESYHLDRETAAELESIRERKQVFELKHRR